ncbi:hypothetical protein Pmani_027075 [Petrolisthes manimaculis]|uniref:Uncharacterized protein n=1 Tax=Petrolisthes manimaculis TaxID=1843537 RepID=A0AAE1TW39_9EUCA|nr:hypothetical protein Pmani_027075 [Petrolisthes manimaculis]
MPSKSKPTPSPVKISTREIVLMVQCALIAALVFASLLYFGLLRYTNIATPEPVYKVGSMGWWTERPLSSVPELCTFSVVLIVIKEVCTMTLLAMCSF